MTPGTSSPTPRGERCAPPNADAHPRYALDIDWHGPTSTALAVNLRAALAWYDWLTARGFHPLLTDSNGVGGYHLLVLLAEAIGTARLYQLVKRLAGDHARQGITHPPETFPKQAELRPRTGRTGYGNWLRLPGRHHSRGHWSRVWDGARWLEGDEAIEFILSLEGDNPALIPEATTEARTAPRRSRSGGGAASNGLAAMIAAYMARLPNLGEGQGRDDVAYTFAAFLARDLNLTDDVVLGWLARWDRGNNPPKGEARLKEILANARLYGKHAFRSGVQTDAVQPHGHTTIAFKVEVY
jgi:hypothetical protein